MAKKKSKGGAIKGENGAGKKKNGVAFSKAKPRASAPYLVMATVSFLVGVLSPPLLQYMSNPKATDLGGSRNLADITHHPVVVSPPRSCNLGSEDLSNFLADEPVPGQHTLCFAGKQLNIFRTSTTSQPDLHHQLTAGQRWAQLKAQLEATIFLKNRRYPVQAWALFTKDGERIVDEDYQGQDDSKILKMIQDAGIVLLFEGGQWIWPGIQKGFTRQVRLDYVPSKGYDRIEKRNATLVTLSLNPLVLSVQGFLSEDECNYIQEAATPDMKYSDVTLMDKDKGRPASDFRTSQSTFLGGTKFKDLEGIDLRTSSLVRIPRSHQEYVQVLRYGNTEKYNAHMDFFDPRHYQNDPNTMRMIEHGKKNRLATVFWYLSDVPKGGETIFPRADKGPHARNTADCSVGLKVKPERGKVIIFYSMTPEGALDEYSLHGACPVEEGIKWAANKWVWNKPTGFYPN